MAKQIFLLCLALFIATDVILAMSTVTTTTKFDNYIAVVDKLTLVSDRLRVFEAVWGEIQDEGAANLTQIKNFYDTLQTRIPANAKAEEHEQAAELAVLVRDVLVADNARLLAETLRNNKSSTVDQVKQFRKELLNSFDEELLNAIFEHAIDEAYPYQSTDVLFATLNSIDGATNATRAYRVRVNWTLYLYNKFLRRGDINDAFVYAAAQALHNFKYESYYSSLSKDTTRRLDLAFNTFTPSLRHLFNTTNICLSNENYKNYYLDFPIENIGSASVLSILAVLRNVLYEHTSWTNSYAGQRIPVGLFYLSTEYNSYPWYLNRQTSDDAIFVLRNQFNSYNVYWTPSLFEDSIMFENNGYYMCATTEFNNNLMGFGAKAVKLASKDDPKCQWAITDCKELSNSPKIVDV